MNDWPEEETLRALLKLPGVSGQTMSDVEDYLSEMKLIHEMHGREVFMLEDGEAKAKASGEDWDPDSLPCEAHELRRRLNAAVNAHWAQLCAVGAV